MTSFGKVLARAVEKHPVLYSQTAQTTAKKDDYDEAWHAVALECDKPVAIIKSRWSKTIKAVMQHLANPAPKSSHGRKTRSSDFQLLDELKWLLPFVNNETATEHQPWDECSMNDESDIVAVTTTAAAAAAHSPTSSSTKTTPNAKSSSSKATNNKTKHERRDSSTDSCTDTDSLANLVAKKNNSSKMIAANLINNDKRRREIVKAYAEKTAEKKKTGETAGGGFFVSEPVLDRSSSIRFRRIVEDPSRKDKAPATEHTERLAAINKLLRRRSCSMYTDREKRSDNDDELDADNIIDDNEADDDVDCQPPPRKKLATVAVTGSKPELVGVNRNAPKGLRGKPRICTIGIKRTINAAIRSPTAASSATSNVKTNLTIDHERRQTNDLDDTPTNLDFENGIDMSIIEAAAAAERAAALEPKTSDNGTQCAYEADDEDNEFLERTRHWLQHMNPRQKVIFRKGVYQAYLDVYDDPRNFDVQKGTDKFMMTQLNGMPALFTGMSPMELRLVRQLAIAVAGSKLNVPVLAPKYGNKDQVKCQSPSMMTGNAAARSTQQQQQQHSSPPNALAHMRAQPSEKPPSVLRTTAIALSNTARSSNSGMQRVLRKVVRVDNTNVVGTTTTTNIKTENTSQNNGGSSASSSSSVGSSGGGGNTNQNNINLARARTVSVNTSNSSNPQRIYRILPNGNIMRHSAGGNSSSTTVVQSPGGLNRPQPTTSTLTTSTGTVITTRNISKPNQLATSTTQMLVDPKTGYIIRRQYTTVSSGAAGNSSSPAGGTSNANSNESSATKTVAPRPPMSRRYSICSIPRELKQHQTSAEQADAMRWSAFGGGGNSSSSPSAAQQSKQQTATNSTSASGGAPPKPIVRVRYAQNQNTAAINVARTSGSANEFVLPGTVSPRKPQNSLIASSSPRNSPVPISISSSGSGSGGGGAAENGENILKRSQQVFENAVHTKTEACSSSVAKDGRLHAQTDKTNCLITSDMIDDFVVKNEPFDQDDEDMLADLMTD